MDGSKSNPFSFSPNDLINAPHNATRKFKILVIEDDLNMAQEMLTTLARAGMECRHTSEGRIGLEALQTRDFHMLLLDLSLPESSGQEICRRARKISTVPLIVLMEHDEHDAQMKCFGLGADDYLIKPFSPQILLLRVASLLRRSYVYDQKRHKHPMPISAIPLIAPVRPPLTEETVPTIEEDLSKPISLPPGWSRCDYCNYMGPTPKFTTQDETGRPVMACPNCGDKSSIAYALG